MSRTILFVTGNEGKLREVQGFLSGCKSIRVIHKKIDLTEIQEASAEIISRKKAEEAFRIINSLQPGEKPVLNEEAKLTPVLVEDTSLSFDVLDGLPGPYIKWFLEKVGCDGLIHMIEGFEKTQKKSYRSAVAMCIFSFCEGYDETGKAIVTQFIGKCHGHIASHARGDHNFGWDPIFVPDEDQVLRTPGKRTFAEMSMSEKSAVSHRTDGLQKLKAHFLIPGFKRDRD